MKISPIIIIVLLIIACSNRQKQAIAHITERRLQNSGKLMISYQFHDGGNLFSDSMEIENRILPHDSVAVVYLPEKPQTSHLLLP